MKSRTNNFFQTFFRKNVMFWNVGLNTYIQTIYKKLLKEKFYQIQMKTDFNYVFYIETTFSKRGLLRTLILTLNFNNQSACRALTKEREIYA